MKHEDVTIVMQGPIGEGLAYLDNYLNLVGRVIVSTWNSRVEIKNTTLVTDDIKNTKTITAMQTYVIRHLVP